MNEDEWDVIYAAEQRFLKRVRDALRRERRVLEDDEMFEAFRTRAQDALSLYSPWMNSRRND